MALEIQKHSGFRQTGSSEIPTGLMHTVLDSISDFISIGIFIMDRNFTITNWNSTCENMFGIKTSDAVGQEMWKLLQPVEDYPGHNDQRKNRLLQQGYLNEVCTYNKSNIDLRYYSIYIKEMSDQVNPGWIAVSTDITSQVSAEKALVESEEKMRSLLNSMDDIVFSFDLNGNYTSAFCIGKTNYHLVNQKELLGKNYRDVLPLDTALRLEEAYIKLLKTRKNQQFDYWLKAGDESRCYNARISPLVNDRGEITGITSVSRNITERKRMEEIIAESAAEWEATFNSLTDQVYIIDTDFHVVRANKSFADGVGRKTEDILGKLCYEVAYGRESVCPNCSILQVMNTGQRIIQDVHSASEGKYYQSVTSPIKNESGTTTAYITSTRDVSEIKLIEEHLKRSQFLASLGTMTAGIAHEVNNPLGSILLLSELLLKNQNNSEIRSDLKIIHSEAKRAAKIMSTLLTYREKTVITNRRLNVNRIIKKVLDIRRYRRNILGIGLYTNIPDDQFYVKGDYSHLTQVFMNILVNAEEALKQTDKGNIIVNITNDGDWVRVSISDNGEGIPKENLDVIFHPFFTTKNPGEGTGLGLSTCYSIVTAHNGIIRAENNELGGATFVVDLPLTYGNGKKRHRRKETKPGI